MWKATAGVKPSISAKPSGKPTIPKKKDLTADDEWDTDPDFVVCALSRLYWPTVDDALNRRGNRYMGFYGSVTIVLLWTEIPLHL